RRPQREVGAGSPEETEPVIGRDDDLPAERPVEGLGAIDVPHAKGDEADPWRDRHAISAWRGRRAAPGRRTVRAAPTPRSDRPARVARRSGGRCTASRTTGATAA